MYKLNPQILSVWTSPTTLQFGVDSTICTLEDLTPSKERFITALRTGFSHKQLSSVAKQAGISTVEAHKLLFDVSAACSPAPRPKKRRICVDGSSSLAHTLANTLAGAGHRVILASARNNLDCDVAFIVADYVIEPYRAADWLRREINHVPVVVGDTRVKIGPVLGTGHLSLCNHCVELYRRDRNPAWPVIASQLVGKPAQLLTALHCNELSALLTRWVSDSSTIPLSRSEGLEYNPENGTYVKERFTFHPECSCQALPQNAILLAS